jgi:hypothetical protein
MGVAGVLLGGLVLCQGCSRPVRGSEGDLEAGIKHGTLTATMDRGIGRVFDAVEQAVNQLNLTTVMAERDGVSAKVLARDTQDQTIMIRLEAISENKTSLAMRVGLFGDDNKTRIIFRRIQENLRMR